MEYARHLSTIPFLVVFYALSFLLLVTSKLLLTSWYYFFHNLLWYCHMSNEIIQSVAYDNYDDFQHGNFIYSQKIGSLFWGLFNDETNL